MKTLATKHRQSTPCKNCTHSYVHHPRSSEQHAQQVAMRKTLRPDDVQEMPDISELDSKHKQDNGHTVTNLPISTLPGTPPNVSRGAANIQRVENEEPEEGLQRQPEDEDEEEKQIQTKLLQRQSKDEEEQEPVQTKRIQRLVSDGCMIQPSRFGYIGPEVKARQPQIRRILRASDIQAKLTIGEPNDKYEQEADRVADQVMSMPDPKFQRQTENEDKEELQLKVLNGIVQRQAEGCEEETLQPKAAPCQTPIVGASTFAKIQSLKGSGQPLADSTRSFFEQRFGWDLSRVRLHSDSKASETARSIHAKAFTVGKDIVFNSGQYSPGSQEGKKLIAHELTHVVQQNHEQNKARLSNSNLLQRDSGQLVENLAYNQLRTTLTNYWRIHPQVKDVLSLNKRQQRRLMKKIANPASYESQDDESGNLNFKEKLSSLKSRQRKTLAKEILDVILPEIQARLLAHIKRLPGMIKMATKSKLQQYALHMATREEHIANNRDQLSREDLRKHRPFPLIFKYIWRRVISRQLSKPREKPYTLDSSYAVPLGLTSSDAILPDLHTEVLVTALKSIPSKSRDKLSDSVLAEILSTLSTYTVQRMATSPSAIAREYAGLGNNMKRNIESDLAGYFSARTGLIKSFGDPSDPAAAIKQASKYYDSLTEAKFLKGYPSKKVGGTSTLVNLKMKEALDNSEKYIKDQGWLDDVLTSTHKYWSTNIRENRNSPQNLSQHSYGMAIDINPEDNPNLAAMSKNNWYYIEEMLGQKLFKFDDMLKQTIRKGDNPDATMTAAKRIRAQSDAYKILFENEANLRLRLIDILRFKGLTLTNEEIGQLLDLAKNIQAIPRKTKKEKRAHKITEKKITRTITDLIFTNLWVQNPMSEAEVIHGPEQELTLILLKLLRRKIKKQTHLDVREDFIVKQISNPVDKVPRQSRALSLGSIYRKSLVKKLRSISDGERKAIAERIVTLLRLRLERKKEESRAKNITRFITQSFSILKGTRKEDSSKIGGGKSMSNIAAQGFSNLSPKLITALTINQGGNLKWLGIHNQDMHHFELKKKPDLPKAPAKS